MGLKDRRAAAGVGALTAKTCRASAEACREEVQEAFLLPAGQPACTDLGRRSPTHAKQLLFIGCGQSRGPTGWEPRVMSQTPGATWCFPASRIRAFTYDTLASHPTLSPLSCRPMNHSDRKASALTPRPFPVGAEAGWSHGQPLPMVASARFLNPTGVSGV